MAKLSDRVAEVLSAECGYNTLAAVMEAKSDKDIKDLISVLSDEKAEAGKRQRAAFVLGRMGAKEAVAPLTKTAPKAEDPIRITIADALGRIGGAKAREALMKLSDDPEPQVRKFAAKGLSRIGDKKALEALQAIASDDAERFVRSIASKALPIAK